MKIIHTLEKNNGPADALSRRPDHDDQTSVQNNILQQQEDGTLTVNRIATTIQQDNEELLRRVKRLQLQDHVTKK